MLDSSRTQAADCSDEDAGVAAPWIAAVTLGAAVATACFLANKLSFGLLTTPDGVAAFWPAAGLAAGTLVAFGPRARAPVAIGVVVATIFAGLSGERSLPASLVCAACNAGEALLIGWLIQRHHGPDFSLDSLPRVLGFFLAIGVAAALSGVGGAAGFALFRSSEATLLATWLHWLASHTVGLVAVAPLVIGMAHAVRRPPRLGELLE